MCHALVSAMLFGVASPAHAAPEACFKAYELGQRLDKDQRPLAAREQYVRCSELCPEPLRKDCIAWQDVVESKLARVVLRVAHAEDEVSVYLDGQPLSRDRFTGPLDQRPALWVTAGRHQLRAKTPGFDDYAETLELLEGEERPIVVSFHRRDAVTPSSGDQLVPWLAIGVGGVGLLGFAYFGSRGLGGKSDLDACRGHCSAEAVDDVRKDFLFADVSLIVGLVGIGVGTFLLLDSQGAKSEPTSSSTRTWIQIGTQGRVSGAWVGGDVW
ncbi:MAG: hypothetical protein KC766_35950 [Myxococcales bacterium]|nr:hypothetical protein [Myxococcales bacterium]